MRLSKKFTAIAVVATAALTGTAAFAFWSTTGGGSGSASTGTSVAVTVSQLGAVSGLVPGGTAQAVDFNINNPRSTPQYITSVLVSIDQDTDGAGVDTGTAWNTGCSALDFTLTQPAPIGADLSGGDHPYQPSGSTLSLNNAPSNQDGCKTQSVLLAFSAS